MLIMYNTKLPFLTISCFLAYTTGHIGFCGFFFILIVASKNKYKPAIADGE